jgi:hypothetical protein
LKQSPESETGGSQGPHPHVRIEGPNIHGDTLLFKVLYHEHLPFLVSNVFYARYDFSLEEIPPSVLSIPILGFLAPLGWLTGAEISAREVDSTYLSSLSAVAQEFRRLYPALKLSGTIMADPTPTPHGWDRGKYCVLYSGGVDSACTLIRNQEKKPSALTVLGSPDLPLEDDRYLSMVRERTQQFTGALGVESHLVETNALGMVNQQAIREHFRGKLKIGWWEELAFGLFYLSASAPYTYYRKIGNVLIGSSNTAQDQVPWGSTPMTDEKVGWGDIKVIHDSYDLTRVDKLRQVILPYAAQHGGAFPLRVCIGRRSVIADGGQLNCGECAKCMMVEMGLILLGADATEFGFNISPAALTDLRRELEAGRFGRAYDPTTWSFIKAKSKSPPTELTSKHPGLREFLDWFATWDERTRRRGILNRVAPPGSRRRDLARAGFGKRYGN